VTAARVVRSFSVDNYIERFWCLAPSASRARNVCNSKQRILEARLREYAGPPTPRMAHAASDGAARGARRATTRRMARGAVSV